MDTVFCVCEMSEWTHKKTASRLFILKAIVMFDTPIRSFQLAQ